MNKQQMMSITFVVSVLVFSAGIDNIIHQDTTVERRTRSTLTQDIASLLIDRGLEERVANERAAALLKKDPVSFASMLSKLPLLFDDISEEDLLNYFAESALHKQSVEWDSYEQLIHLHHRITHATPDRKRRELLAGIAEQNASIGAKASKSQNFIV